MYLLKAKVLSRRITGGLQWLVNITAVIYNAKNIRLEILQIVMMRKFNIRSESSRKQRDTP